MEPWLVQAIVSGARSDARNGSRDHTGEKRHKDQQWDRIDSVRHFFISCRPTPHLLFGENLGCNGPQFRATRGFIQASLSPAIARPLEEIALQLGKRGEVQSPA